MLSWKKRPYASFQRQEIDCVMKVVRVQLLNKKRDLAEKCSVADSFLSRLIGLIGTRSLEEGEGMLFPATNNVHLWWMSIPIDVVFLKEQGEERFSVTSIRSDLKPWKLLPVWDRQATHTLELPAGCAEKAGLREGDGICISW